MYKKIIAGIMSMCMLCPISANAEENNVLYGDANCDGIVDICDITALKQHLIGIEKLSDKGIENCGFFNNEVSIKSLGQITKYLINEVENLQFSYYDDGIYNEYEPFDYKNFDNHDYDSNIVTIVIKHQYSNLHKEWTPEDFKLNNSQVLYIKDMTAELKDCIEKLPDTWVQILTIYLTEDDSENLKEIVSFLEDKALSGECPEIYSIGWESSQEPNED